MSRIKLGSIIHYGKKLYLISQVRDHPEPDKKCWISTKNCIGTACTFLATPLFGCCSLKYLEDRVKVVCE